MFSVDIKRVTTAGKIRLLLFVLFASLMFTAIVVEKTYTPADNLAQTARVLETNLHEKENHVYNIINNKKSFDDIKALSFNSVKAAAFINDNTLDKRIWVLTYKNDRLFFW